MFSVVPTGGCARDDDPMGVCDGLPNLKKVPKS